MKKNLFNPQNTKTFYHQFLLLLILFLCSNAWGQTTVFSDDFGSVQSDTYTTSGVIGTSPWTVNRSGADWGARRSSAGQLDVTNDASATTNVAGWGFANVALSSFSTPFSSTLNSNSGLVTWTFNFRTNRTSALAGFSATTSYGLAYILAGTSATAGTAGTGYAVVMGGGSNNNIALIKYSTGLQGTRTTIIGYGNTPTNLTDYISVKVTYNPNDNTWNLYTRDDGTTSFADPSAGTLTQIGTSTVDNTYTSTAMSFSGAYWQGSTGATQFSTFDNYKVTVVSAATCAAPTSPSTTGVTSSSATLSWTAPTSVPASGYQYYLSTTNTAPDASTTPTGNVASGTSVNVSVSANTTYYWWVRSNCSTSDKSSWVSGGNFTTSQLAASFPYSENFEGTNGNNWTFVNGSQTNKWFVGSAVNNGGSQSLYISNNASGTTHNYANTTSVVQVYRDITIPAGSTNANISFDWRANGETFGSTKYDYFSVWIVPASFNPTAGSVITTVPSRIKVGDFNLVNTWGNYTNNSIDVSSFAGTTMRLVFEWQNDGSGGAQAPAAIDNLAVTLPQASTTVTPTSLTGFTATTASDSAQQSFTVSGVTLGSNNITITPSTGYQISTTSGSGYSSTPIVLTPTSGTVGSTTIYVVLKKNSTTGAANGSITVSASPAVTPDKTVSLAGTISKATFTSANSGNWETAANWDLNAVPGADDNVVILSAHTITATTAQTRNSGTTTTVSGVLATNDSYLNNGTTTINGTFQINANGWGGGSNDFVYGSSGNLIFAHNNGSEYGSIDATHRYWPATSGPVNVTINSNSPINLGVARTVTGILQVAAGFRNLGNITVGTNGTLRLNSGYSWLNANSSPVYGTSSKLIYNSGGSPGRSNEWTASTGTVGTTAGLPQDVQVSNNTAINFPNGNTATGSGTVAAMAGGIVTVDSGSAIYLDYGTNGNSALIVTKDLLLNGSLSLGNAEGGNITVGGNWTQATAATFSPKGRRVIFNGSAAQTITKTGGGTLDFDRLEIQKTNATNVSLSNAAGNLTSLNLNGTSLNALAITGSGTGSLNLNANTLTFNNDGGDIYVDAAKTIVASSGAVINFNANKKVSNNSGTGSLTFAANATININNNAIVDFGKSSSTNISTVNGVLNIVGNGSSVTPNGPIYATGSKLVYKTAGIYARKAEWNATSGAGYPYDVQVTANTTLNYPNTGSGAFSTALGIARDLTIDSGSSLYMDYGNGGNKSGSLTVGRNIVNSGSLSLGDFAGGDLSLGGSWTSSGTFIPNNRAVTFSGSDGNDQTINSATTFDYLTVNKTSTGSVVLAASIIVNKDLTLTNKSIVLGTNNLTLPNNSSIINSNANSYIQAIGTGRLIRQNVDGTKDWVFPMGVAAAGRYAPITIKNLSGTTDLSVNVSTSITPTVSDATRVLSTKWLIATTNNVTANIYTEWQGVAAETNSMTIPATGSLATTVGGAPYTFYNVNLVANNTTATAVSLSNTAANGIVIGNDNAISIANDECSGAINITVDAVAVSGSNKGATSSSGFSASPCSSSSNSRDVWYKFTTSNEGNYKITVFKSTGTGAMSDPVLDLRSGTCVASVNIGCSDGLGDEVVTLSLNANTTYYYRVFNYGSATGDGFFTTSVSTVPTVIVNPIALTYGDVTYNTTSDKTFTVKGNFLNPANDNISIASLSGYEYSLDGVAYSTSLTLPYTSKTLAETTVHVRFNPTSACTDYNGNISVSGGGATTANIAVTGRGVIQAPTANTATDITTNSFVANWTTVSGVTDYELDVYTKGIVSNTVLNATFDDVTGASGNTGGNDGQWSGSIASATVPAAYTAAGWALTAANGADKSLKVGSGSTLGVLTTPDLVINGSGTLTFRAGAWNGTSESTSLKLSATNATLDLATVTLVKGSFNTYTVQVTNVTGNVKISFTGGGAATTSRFFIDDIKVVTSGIGNIPIAGSTFTVSAPATSKLINGLTQGQTYYYKIRGINGTCKSADSNEIEVTTNNTIIWNNNAWTNTTGPDTTLDAIIRTPYYVKANADEFAVHNLTIENTGLLKIKTGHGITVSGDIITPDNKIIIESDASLTQTKIANGNSNNKAIAKRNVKMKTLDYTYWSSPLQDQVLLNTTNVNAANSSGGFSAGTPNNRTYEYNEVTDNFKATTNATFVPAKGYAIRGKSTYGTVLAMDSLTFSGNLHNGDYSIQIQKSKNTTGTGGVIYEHGYNLIGNPYPSNINFINFYNLDQGNGNKNSDVIYGKAWFWTNFSASGTQAGSSYAGNNYATITLAGGTSPTSVDSAEGNPMPNEFIKVAQGFIVQMKGTPPTGTTPNLGIVKFDNSIRTNNNTGHFYNNNKNADEGINRYWVKIVSPYNIANTILIAHMDGATNNYDPDYDAELLAVGDDSFYSKVNAQKLQIQARNNPLNNEDVIVLGTKHAMSGLYKISLGNREGVFAENQKIYLRDKLTETYTDLTIQDYSFNANQGIDDNRFEIVYKNKEVLGTEGIGKSDFLVYRDGNNFVVKSSNNLGKVELYDVTGKLVQSRYSSDKEVKFDSSVLISGVYIIKAENSGNIRTKKIIK
ncbi:T9SS type A sorting domain-containing protein [Epilithonimonas zeae]|uniref:Por secretion system C-terminal sorting domain-containing protein n=1 Tax=Epilithonimonas zeae TaxID=1416779 RepID=A0A1N6HG75_9FLAO|nr:T9SS type A sorting domain-containing protein [Epilithonimonas zeae]SIO18737.1 Por secretion system C-terminal sorting domain-containing protein [Epilithonimonas zeae]